MTLLFMITGALIVPRSFYVQFLRLRGLFVLYKGAKIRLHGNNGPMKNNIKKLAFIGLISAVVTLAAYAQQSPATGQQGPATGQQGPPQGPQHGPPMKPKNLKILSKDISHEELMKVMNNFKVSLGVKCGFCHAKNPADSAHLEFASDAKPEKKMARYMMHMTTKINKKYFRDFKAENGTSIQVGCITCHHGQPHPEI